MTRVYRIQYSVLLAKLGYTVAAMHAAKGELAQTLMELRYNQAPLWIASNIRYHLTTQSISITAQNFTGSPF